MGSGGPPLGPWRFHLAIATLLLPLAGLGIVGWRGVRVIPAHWVAHAVVLLPMAGLAWAIKGRVPRVAAALVAGAWVIAAGAASSPVSYAAVRTGPLWDRRLAAWDLGMGGPWPGPWATVYDLLAPLSVLAVLLVPGLGDLRRARVMVAAYAASFWLALPLMIAGAAEGPWAVSGAVPSTTQAAYVEVFRRLRAPGAFRFDTAEILGVVTFPSYHALLAVLAGVALARVRGVGPIAVALATGIVLATVGTGWHYLADTVVGVALGGLAIGVGEAGERWGWGRSLRQSRGP